MIRGLCEEYGRFEAMTTLGAQNLPELLTSMIQTSQDAVIIADVAGKIILWNDSAERVFKLSAAEALGRETTVILNSGNEPERLKLLQAIKSGQATEASYAVPVNGTGRFIPLAISVFPLMTSGKLSGTAIIAKDPRIRREFEEQRSILSSIVDSSDDAIISHDLNGKIMSWNRGATKIYGFTSKEAIGQHMSILAPPESKNEIFEIIDRLKAGEKIDHYQTIRVRKNGERINVSLTISAVYDSAGNIIGASKIARDVTTEYLLQSQQAFLASIIESSDDAILTKDLDGIITSWNRGANRLYGYTPQEVIGKHVSMLAAPEAVSEIPGIMEKLRNGFAIEHYETVRLKKNGERMFVSLTISPLRDASGKLIGASAIARNVTEQKKANDQIKNQLREKEVLLQEVHHRVKNNLQVISSLLELRARSGKEKESEKNPAFVESIERIRAMSLIHEKLYQSKDVSSIDFSGYITTLGDHLIKGYNFKPTNIHFSVEGDSCLLPLDTAVPLGLVLNELITNSLKYAFEKRESGHIRVRIDVAPERVRLQVADDGIGLPPEFDLASANSFGFRIVRLLMQQLDGTIGLYTGAGAKFDITLPLQTEQKSI